MVSSDMAVEVRLLMSINWPRGRHSWKGFVRYSYQSTSALILCQLPSISNVVGCIRSYAELPSMRLSAVAMLRSMLSVRSGRRSYVQAVDPRPRSSTFSAETNQSTHICEYSIPRCRKRSGRFHHSGTGSKVTAVGTVTNLRRSAAQVHVVSQGRCCALRIGG